MKKISTIAFTLLLFIAQLANAQCTTVLLKQGAGRAIDAHISDNHPTQNYPDDSLFLAMHWTILGVPVGSKGLMKFDLNSIPIGATITSARLNLYADSTSERSYSHQPMYGSNNACYLKMVTQPWQKNIVTWNTQPATTSTGQVLLPQSTAYIQNYLNLDVTNFVQQWVNNPYTNYGMMLEMITNNYYNSMIFCSSDFPDSTLWPSLEVCYIPQSPCNTTAGFTYHHSGSGVVNFTNTSVSDNNYYSSWVFYNSHGIIDVSNSRNPTVTYTGTEPFFASLTVTDSTYAACYNTTVQVIDLIDCITFKPGLQDAYNAHITSAQPSSNYNNYTDFVAMQWATGSTPFENRGLLKMDVSAIPPGSTVVSAFLDLFADTLSTDGFAGTPMYGTTNASYLLKVTAPWDKSTVTWATQPATTTTNQVFLGQMRGDINYQRVDIAPFVQDWVNAPAQNYGMLLDMISNSYYNSLIFCSSTNADSSLRPTLTVCYISGSLNAGVDDTLCGFVFSDVNENGIYDSGDMPQAYATMLIDGDVYYAGADGRYSVNVSTGNHSITIIPAYGQQETYPGNGTYTVNTAGGQGICGFDFGLSATTTGVSDVEAATALRVYPNPVTGGAFNVLLPEGLQATATELYITDMVGRRMAVDYTAKQQGVIHVNAINELAAGVYTLAVVGSGNTRTTQLVVLSR